VRPIQPLVDENDASEQAGTMIDAKVTPETCGIITLYIEPEFWTSEQQQELLEMLNYFAASALLAGDTIEAEQLSLLYASYAAPLETLRAIRESLHSQGSPDRLCNAFYVFFRTQTSHGEHLQSVLKRERDASESGTPHFSDLIGLIGYYYEPHEENILRLGLCYVMAAFRQQQQQAFAGQLLNSFLARFKLKQEPTPLILARSSCLNTSALRLFVDASFAFLPPPQDDRELSVFEFQSRADALKKQLLDGVEGAAENLLYARLLHAGNEYALRYVVPCCHQCKTSEKVALMRCVGCGAAYYCNGVCQKAAWKSHKPLCMHLRSGLQ
jgi:hypothetical protein